MTAKDELVMEEREELMSSPTATSSHERYRKAHFLLPRVTSLFGPSVAAPNLLLDPTNNKHIKRDSLPLKVEFRGWRYPKHIWKTWVNQMKTSHLSTWKTAGIHDAIINSTYTIHRDTDLIFGLADRWCPSTNTFVFPWGEATVTLEDVMVIGGYSVLGDSVLSDDEGGETEDAVVNQLARARADITKRTNMNKADHNKWMALFMGSGSEVEHAAFLACWLSRFVFTYRRDSIGSSVLRIAVRLARGSNIALAPPVLASIYKSLTLLKVAVFAARKSRANEQGRINDDVLNVTVAAPFPLLQVWVWERFLSLRPKPNPVSVRQSKPRLSRWHKLKKLGIGAGDSIDCAGEEFQWRPYATTSEVYMHKAYWVKVGSGLDEDLEGLVRCLRTSELVGLEEDCIEQYLPHRVARQFGMDQDLPGHVARVNVTPEVAWRDYCRPIRDTKLYVPARVYQPEVTTPYLKWWKTLYIGWSGVTTNTEPGAIEIMDNTFKVEVKSDEEFVPRPPGCPPKWANADFVAQQVGQGQKSPLSSTARKGRRKRKFVVSSSDDDCDRLSPRGAASKHSRRVEASSKPGIGIEKGAADLSSSGIYENNQSRGKNCISCTANNGNTQVVMVSDEPIESEVKCTLTKEASNRVVKMIGVSPSRVESSVSESTGIGLEEKISNIEKLCAFLKARNLVCLG